MSPEYIHVLLNPLPLYGMAAGAFILLVASLQKNPAEQRAALLWVLCVAVATGVAVWYGERGFDRVLSMSNDEAQQWLKVHQHRAETLQYLFYATGLSALLALLPWIRSERRRLLAGLTLALALGSATAAGWISCAGGQVRHSEFRDGPP